MSGRAKPVETLSTCLLDLESMYSRNHGISFAARQRWFQQEQLVDVRSGEPLVVVPGVWKARVSCAGGFPLRASGSLGHVGGFWQWN